MGVNWEFEKQMAYFVEQGWTQNGSLRNSGESTLNHGTAKHNSMATASKKRSWMTFKTLFLFPITIKRTIYIKRIKKTIQDKDDIEERAKGQKGLEWPSSIYKPRLHIYNTNLNMPQNYQISQSYLAIRLDLNSFVKCWMVLQCFILASNEFHKIGPVIRMDRSENIFFGFMNTMIFGISCGILMDLVYVW